MKYVAIFIKKLKFIFFGNGSSLWSKDELGNNGEQEAATYLKRQGYRIIDKNVRFSIGEIDIIAKIGTTIVLVEVKTRRSNEYCHPIEVVDKKKREKIKKMGQWYYRNKKHADRGFAMRFDIITVIWPEDKQPMIEHFVDAFR